MQGNAFYYVIFNVLNIFMPPPLGAGWFMYSGCPSVRWFVRRFVRSARYSLCTSAWVRWSIRPTVSVFRHVRSSVRLERFPDISWEAWGEWPEIVHADVSWTPLEMIRLWSRSVEFPPLVPLWLNETGQIWCFRVFTGKGMKVMAWIFAGTEAYFRRFCVEFYPFSFLFQYTS